MFCTFEVFCVWVFELSNSHKWRVRMINLTFENVYILKCKIINVFTFDVLTFENVYILKCVNILKCQLCSSSTSLSIYTHTHTYLSLVLSQCALGSRQTFSNVKTWMFVHLKFFAFECLHSQMSKLDIWKCSHSQMSKHECFYVWCLYIWECKNVHVFTFGILAPENVYILRCTDINVFTFVCCSVCVCVCVWEREREKRCFYIWECLY